jgi:hypothetical protein
MLPSISWHLLRHASCQNSLRVVSPRRMKRMYDGCSFCRATSRTMSGPSRSARVFLRYFNPISPAWILLLASAQVSRNARWTSVRCSSGTRSNWIATACATILRSIQHELSREVYIAYGYSCLFVIRSFPLYTLAMRSAQVQK